MDGIFFFLILLLIVDYVVNFLPLFSPHFLIEFKADDGFRPGFDRGAADGSGLEFPA